MNSLSKIAILHVFLDEKFFDDNSAFFEELGTNNIYAFYTEDKDYKFKFIKSDRVTVFNNKSEYLKLFSSPDIDAVYFHSLNPYWYYLFNYIDKKKKVFWFSWGYDIYCEYLFHNPIISLNLYGKKTRLFKERDKGLKYSLLCLKQEIKDRIKCRYLFYNSFQQKILNRIDYYSPVLPIEYDLLETKSCFKAKPIMLNGGPFIPCKKIPFTYHKTPGNIQIGNSLTYENNHLEILDVLKNINLKNRKYILPISYGGGYGGVENFIKLVKVPHEDCIFLKGFIPIDEYSKINRSVSHAIFGMIRQQAIGNIYMCFKTGVKVFLPKDSINYKFFKSYGFLVFTIEHDLNQESLLKPLSEQDALLNYNLYYRFKENYMENAKKEFSKVFTLSKIL